MLRNAIISGIEPPPPNPSKAPPSLLEDHLGPIAARTIERLGIAAGSG